MPRNRNLNSFIYNYTSASLATSIVKGIGDGLRDYFPLEKAPTQKQLGLLQELREKLG